MPTRLPFAPKHDPGADLAETIDRSIGLSGGQEVLLLRPRSYHVLGGSLPRPIQGARLSVIGQLGDYHVRQIKDRLTGISNRVQVQGFGPVHISWIARGHRLRFALSQMCPPGSWAIVSGQADYFGRGTQLALRRVDMEPADLESIRAVGAGERWLLPLYPLSGKLRQHHMRGAARQLVEARPVASLPSEIERKLQLPSLTASLRVVHGLDPVSEHQSREILLGRSSFQRRLDIERLYLLMEALRQDEQLPATSISGSIEDLLPHLAFTLTPDQKSAVEDVLGDLRQRFVTRRLIQGDVACGKTVVPQLALVAVARAGLHGAYLAPTEMLARQVASSTLPLAARAGIPLHVLGGRMKAAERRRVENLARGATPAIFVGTHVLANLPFSNLGLLVVDEEQRFGLEVKERLTGHNPHVLWMSATPIPRSLAQVRYGGHELTLIRSRPPGRGSVRTKIVSGLADRMRLLDYMRIVLSHGRQIYVVCPAIETDEMANVESIRAQLSEALGPDRVGVLHRGLEQNDIETALQRFREGHLGVLVATTIIEVGIDVPNATLMVIHDPERLGLSQLHQIRGRVGRGPDRGYCALVTDAKGPARERLRYFARTHDGLELAEADLRTRGAGQFSGLIQSGFGDVDLLAYVDEIQVIHDHLISPPGQDDSREHPTQGCGGIAPAEIKPFTVDLASADDSNPRFTAMVPAETHSDIDASFQFEVTV